MTTLAERFARSQGQPQEVNGVVVQNIYRRIVSQGAVVRVRRVQATASPTQGLRIKVNKGSVLINGQKHKEVVLWADSAPASLEIVCDTGKAPSAELRAWNCWRDEDGVMQAWLGDAGMIIQEDEQRVSLRCGDGTHAFDATDLEVELIFA
jgi:hypothetical protein